MLLAKSIRSGSKVQNKINTSCITMSDTIASDKISVKNTGNVSLTASYASELFIEIGTGNVAGTLLADKVFITHRYRKKDVPTL